MATNKPRVMVTLEPHAHEVISRLSAAGGESMSALIGHLVTVSLPPLERLVVVLERANEAPAEVHKGLAAAIDRAERVLRPVLSAALDQQDFLLSDIEDMTSSPEVRPDALAQRGRRGAPRVLAKPKDPRLVTRGSGGSRKRGEG